MSQRTASSQAAWALLTEGVTSARVEAHRLRHLISRAQKLVEESEHREHIHQVAGDLLLAVPQRLDRLEIDLDRTALALSKMGEDFLEARLPLSDKNEVDEAVQSAFGGGRMRTSVDRLARRWLQAGIENGRLDNSVRQQANRDLIRSGLDGNGRFQKIGQALNVAFKVLEKYGIEPDEVLSADRHRAPSGTWPIDLAFSNPEDSFSPVSIRNSVLHLSWTQMDNGMYEVVAYLS